MAVKYITLTGKESGDTIYPNIKPQNIEDESINAGAKLAPLSVTKSRIANGSIDSDKLDSGAVTQDKIGAGAVTEDKIGAGAVTHSKIGLLAVHLSNVKLVSQAVIDADTGDTFDDLLDWIVDAVRNGYLFYFDNGNGEVSQCLVSRDGQELRISNPLALQGFQTSYTIDSASAETFFAGDGASLCYVGIGE